jgi:single-strand DNA-binding protein
LQTRSWEDQKTGQKRYTTEIVAQNVQFVGGGNGATRDRGVGQVPQPGQQIAGGGGSAGNYGYGGGGGGGYGASSGGASSAPSYSGGSSPGASSRPDTPRRFENDPLEPGDSGDFGGVPPPGLEEIPF